MQLHNLVVAQYAAHKVGRDRCTTQARTSEAAIPEVNTTPLQLSWGQIFLPFPKNKIFEVAKSMAGEDSNYDKTKKRGPQTWPPVLTSRADPQTEPASIISLWISIQTKIKSLGTRGIRNAMQY